MRQSWVAAAVSSPGLTIGRVVPLVRLRTYELVAQRLVQEIADGSLPEGALLPGEVELAETLGVGRSSVREALRVLGSRGLIERVEGRRFAVANHSNPVATALGVLYDLGTSDLREFFDLLRLVETQAAGRAATERRERDLATIGSSVAAMRQGAETVAVFLEADLQFHVAVANAAGNRATVKLIEGLRDVLRSTLYEPMLDEVGGPNDAAETIEEHTCILEAIESRDAGAACEAMRVHLDRAFADAVALLEGATSTTPIHATRDASGEVVASPN